ncbi:MAG: HAD-IIA family hydrolase [Pseudomonadota bacterium]
MTTPKTCTAEWIFSRYEQIRERLPKAKFKTTYAAHQDISALTDQFDAFLFDSFGVLNAGETPIPGAAERIGKLRAAGKQVLVLTNAATGPLSSLTKKYARLGFDFSIEEIVSSREVLQKSLAAYDRSMLWAIAAPASSEIDELDIRAKRIGTDEMLFSAADGFILLSSSGWNSELQGLLCRSLQQRPRPLLVGNPDLAAPREDWFSIEPGSYAHAIMDETRIVPEFFGKPFANTFEVAIRRLDPDIPRCRIAMVGDTLHTDILGGAAAGLGTILVTDHGVLKDLNLADCIDTSMIIPDYIIPRI